MSFNREIYDAHLKHAKESSNLLDKYLSLWRAFNYYYECNFHYSDDENIMEQVVFHRAVDAIRIQHRGFILDAAISSQLDLVSPILNMRALRNSNSFPQRAHEKLKKALSNHLSRRPVGIDDINIVVDLLYVIRCNATHGFKTPNGPRDNDVLRSAVPVLEALISKLDLN